MDVDYIFCFKTDETWVESTSTTDASLVKTENVHYSQEERHFHCNVCLLWFIDVGDLFSHIEQEHEDIQLTPELEKAMYKQWKSVIKIEKVIMDLIAINKYKSAKRLLKKSSPFLSSISTSLFMANDNIFEHFIASMQMKIKKLIKKRKNITNDTQAKNIRKRPGKHLSTHEKTLVDELHFSSDDDICLKDALKKDKPTSYESDKCFDSITLQKISYYILPEWRNGKKLDYLDNIKVKVAIKDIITKKEYSLDFADDIVVKRCDIEVDEIVPEDAIIINEFVLPEKSNLFWSHMPLTKFLSRNVVKKQTIGGITKIKSEEDINVFCES